MKQKFYDRTGQTLAISPSRVKPAYGGATKVTKYQFSSEWTMFTVHVADYDKGQCNAADIRMISSGQRERLSQFSSLLTNIKYAEHRRVVRDALDGRF